LLLELFAAAADGMVLGLMPHLFLGGIEAVGGLIRRSAFRATGDLGTRLPGT